MLFLPKLEDISAEIEGYFYQNSLFRQKELLSAETPSFGSFGISAEMFLFEVLSFGYRQKEEISLSVAHYNSALSTIQQLEMRYLLASNASHWWEPIFNLSFCISQPTAGPLL